jgi:hypothetical protein
MKVEYPEWMARYQKPQVLIGAAALILVLALAFVWTAWRWNIALDRMEMLKAQAAEGFLRPPSSTQTVRIDARAGGLTGIDAGGLPKRIDLAIAVRSDRYARFRIALSREDGTALLHTERLAPDSNGNLHLSFNSTLLPSGFYKLRIQGYSRRGELLPFAETRLQIAGR